MTSNASFSPSFDRGPNTAIAGTAPSISNLALAMLLLLLAAVWFASSGARVLIHPDEGRYAVVSLEMARSGDWVTPRLNGLLYFEKPPLQYWIGALCFKLFGVNEFAARFWPAMSGFLTVLLVGYTGGRLWGRETGLRSLAIAASTSWIIGNSHFLTLDAGLTLFLSLALCAVLLAAYASPEPAMRRRWIHVAWVAMAGAVLSKGLVGIVIPGAVLVFASLWRRDLTLWRGMQWASGLVVFCVLTAPWFVLVSLRNPGFAQFFFIHEHFARYLTTVHQRDGAWWYYLPLALGGLLPWTTGLLGRWRQDVPTRAAGAVQVRDLLIVWAVFVLVFFSISSSKLPSYILPMFPALALLLAVRIDAARIATLRRHLLVPVGVWVLALLASTQVKRGVSPYTPIEALRQVALAVDIGAALFLGAAAIAWWCLGRERVTLAVWSVALGHVFAVLCVIQAHDALGQYKSAAQLSAALRPLIDERVPVFSVHGYDQTLPFYLGRDIVLVDYEDEFALGQQREPGKSLRTVDEFVARWQALPRAAAYVDFVAYLELQRRGLPMRIVFRDFRRAVVMKP